MNSNEQATEKPERVSSFALEEATEDLNINHQTIEKTVRKVIGKARLSIQETKQKNISDEE